MENAVLLSPSDVRVIRRYVQTKYAPLPEARRAEIVADAIRKAIQHRLPDLPHERKTRLADELIRRCLIGEQREIRPEDVLNVCAELGFRVDFAGTARPVPEHGAWPKAADPSARVNADPDPVLESERPLVARIPKLVWLLCAAAVTGGVLAGSLLKRPVSEAPPMTQAPTAEAFPMPETSVHTGKPPEWEYQTFDQEAVIAYLKSRDSMLADEPYFSAIVDSAREYDLHPLLLLAITGQEQGFVPKSKKNAKTIANNPFNVYRSWAEYNTDIHDAAAIAARTVNRRISTRPEDADPFHWLNMTYAEDPNWGAGVKQIFEKLISLGAAPRPSP